MDEARYQGLSRPGLSSLEGRRLTGLVPGPLWHFSGSSFSAKASHIFIGGGRGSNIVVTHRPARLRQQQNIFCAVDQPVNQSVSRLSELALRALDLQI